MSRHSSTQAGPASVAIVGADTVLAALPATPIQLAHACRALGYELAVPASWGDELVAHACLAGLRTRGPDPVILCTCPHVFGHLTRNGPELVPWMMLLPAPPVAAARYVRAAYATRPVHITYIGSCPSATDPSIDARLSPEELFSTLAARGIVAADQPEFFDSLLSPDRRRFYSLPGGVPAPEQLAAVDPRRALIEPEGDDFLLDLGQLLVSRQRVLIDVAPQHGCVCSGVLVPGAVHGARPALVALEPPRAGAPVLDPSISIDLDMTPALEPAAGPASSPARVATGEASIESSVAGPRHEPRLPLRRRPAPPSLRSRDGLRLPRAFAAHRGRRRLPNRGGRPRTPQLPHYSRGGSRLANESGTRSSNQAPRELRSSSALAVPPPGPVPPPPARHRSTQLASLGAATQQR